MSSVYDNFGTLAGREFSFTELAGRYDSQSLDERRIVSDVLAKLSPDPSYRLLEIGCGPGNLLIPLSFFFKSATGIDHPDVIQVLKRRFCDQRVELIGGNFIDPALPVNGPFDRILAYSVIQCLQSNADVEQFIDKALSLLVPGGRILIGDLPNIDRKARFLGTDTGKRFHEDWREKNAGASSTAQSLISSGSTNVTFDDDSLVKLVLRIRKAGHEAFLLEQPAGLPFGRTREDLLIVKQLP